MSDDNEVFLIGGAMGGAKRGEVFFEFIEEQAKKGLYPICFSPLIFAEVTEEDEEKQ